MRNGKLALEGGEPIRKKPISYGRQSIDDEDVRAVAEALRSDYLTQGPIVAAFENAFAEFVGRGFAVAFSNGTAALHGAYFGLGLGPGDEILTSPMTFASTANAALFLGAKVRFADVLPENGLIDPEIATKRIGKKTKILCPIHYGGMLADMDALRSLAQKKGLFVVEDACHALGATGFGGQAGALGDIGVFSFHPVKHITTGEGGMAVTDSPDLYEKMTAFRTHGIVKNDRLVKKRGPWFYEMRDLGFNYRLTDFQCALGLTQLKKYPAFLVRRLLIASRYDAFFREFDGVKPCRPLPGTQSAYHLYPVLIDNRRFKGGRRAVFEALHAEGIRVQVHYIPVNAHPYYRKLGFDPAGTPKSREFYNCEISLPIFPAMTDSDIRDVMDAVTKVCDALRR